MRLAKKTLVITLTMLALFSMVLAQRSEEDPRNTAPTVGTGGPVGGPTGLFTVYDGTTLRKGEFTFSAAYSNYDRDPGDVDFTEVPISFQVGLTDNMELFFNTDAYRAVKVNSPRNLSGFYLPNNAGASLPAIIYSPGGLFNNRAIFRPAGSQPFVQYPFTGGSAGLFGFNLNTGIPAQDAVAAAALINALGGNPPLMSAAGGGTGNTANNFPGLGSIYGGILPGVVLQTTILPGVPGLGPGATMNQTVPSVFALAPSYVPDAPMLNRTYGESAFSTFTVGAKIRLTGNDNPVGFGFIPFYRFYNDSAGDIGGFNQLQRGASPGGERGDIGLVAFADARLRKWLNVSANVGYIYNSSIKGNLGGQDVTLLDRGDELMASIGLDFPVNKYFQPILEFRSLQYVGGRTPNAFENNPLDAIAGVRVFATRYAGLSAAYRYHANQQSRSSIEDSNFNGTTTVASVNPLNVATVTSNFTGVPPGFRTSSDPHGFILQGFIGRRNSRESVQKNQPANVTGINLSSSTISLGCPPGQASESDGCDDDKTISVTTAATDPENDPLTYNYTVSGGKIVGSGGSVSWDLSGVGAGTYTITAGVDDGCGVCGDTKTETVTVAECADCKVVCECPTSISVTDPPVAVAPGENMTFTANVVGGDQSNLTYAWSVDQGSIVEGQGTPTITVNTSGLSETTVNATVSLGGLCDTCDSSAS
ncbi:MAG: immunoglobulin domain-containing protein, partial [Pyrinomonadaceae bacterium]|nr:immunoglobulin domain-containing protein [Pyrinomonadaceae bacterium]